MIARRIQDVLDLRYHRRRFAVILLMMHPTFSDMEDSRSSHRHRDQTGFGAGRYPGATTGRQTRLRDVLQTPVPVVIVVRAKLGRAFS